MRSIVRLALLVVVWVGLLGLTPDIARAQSPEARAHFARGLELYDEGRLVEALAEFEEAYRIAPTPALLFNLAQLHADLGHAVEATDAYEGFLRDAGPSDAELRGDAERALAVQRARIGRLSVEVSVAGARVFLDDAELGTSPLAEPVRVSAGEHVVMAQIAGFETQRHRFRIAGGARYAAVLTLVPSGSRGASLRIESTVPGVDVRVDGAPMGLTPLDATVPVSAGSHRVEGLREGYASFALDVTATDGSETLVVLQTPVDPRAPASVMAPLAITVPDAPTTVRVDGTMVVADASLVVPIGLHDVDVRAADREPIQVRVDVLPGEGYRLEPVYTWTPDGRGRRIDEANRQRLTGLVPLLIGAPIAVASLSVLLWDVTENLGNLGRLAALYQQCEMIDLSECEALLVSNGHTDNYTQFQSDYTREDTVYHVVLGVSIATLSISTIVALVGVGMLAAAPSEDDIDRAARADFRIDLDIGPGSLGVHGTF